jgi:hypothetical protein
VQLEAIALEPLQLEQLAFDLLLMLIGGREAEDRQAAVLLPELTDATADALAGLGEAALIGLRAGALGSSQQQCAEQKREGDEPPGKERRMDPPETKLIRCVNYTTN